VNRTSSSISLKDENAGTLGIGRVVLDHDRSLDTVDHLTGKNTVLCYLIVAMGRDPNIAVSDEGDDTDKRFAHVVVASVTLA
jgi:hypothetical protein